VAWSGRSSRNSLGFDGDIKQELFSMISASGLEDHLKYSYTAKPNPLALSSSYCMLV